MMPLGSGIVSKDNGGLKTQVIFGSTHDSEKPFWFASTHWLKYVAAVSIIHGLFRIAAQVFRNSLTCRSDSAVRFSTSGGIPGEEITQHKHANKQMNVSSD